jgi:hypothetical protein
MLKYIPILLMEIFLIDFKRWLICRNRTRVKSMIQSGPSLHTMMRKYESNFENFFEKIHHLWNFCHVTQYDWFIAYNWIKLGKNLFPWKKLQPLPVVSYLYTLLTNYCHNTLFQFNYYLLDMLTLIYMLKKNENCSALVTFEIDCNHT